VFSFLFFPVFSDLLCEINECTHSAVKFNHLSFLLMSAFCFLFFALAGILSNTADEVCDGVGWMWETWHVDRGVGVALVMVNCFSD